ncbi:unnamed protein product [Amoebophrya sp. A25]|nr:unnamed protein product [Amoebophrya sp. A25]|eukprot:GSA25T00001676001.1
MTSAAATSVEEVAPWPAWAVQTLLILGGLVTALNVYSFWWGKDKVQRHEGAAGGTSSSTTENNKTPTPSSPSSRKASSKSSSVERASFRHFQLSYLVVYLSIMLADWLQGTNMYTLYEGYGVDTGTLFLTGFLSSAILGTYLGLYVDLYGRKRACVFFCLVELVINAIEHVNSYQLLLFGRVLSGISSSLLFSAFEAWMVTEHRRRGVASAGNGLVAIAGGLLAQVAADRHGDLGPFQVAIGLTCFVLVLILLLWEEGEGGRTSMEMTTGVEEMLEDSTKTRTTSPLCSASGARRNVDEIETLQLPRIPITSSTSNEPLLSPTSGKDKANVVLLSTLPSATFVPSSSGASSGSKLRKEYSSTTMTPTSRKKLQKEIIEDERSTTDTSENEDDCSCTSPVRGVRPRLSATWGCPSPTRCGEDIRVRQDFSASMSRIEGGGGAVGVGGSRSSCRSASSSRSAAFVKRSCSLDTTSSSMRSFTLGSSKGAAVGGEEQVVGEQDLALPLQRSPSPVLSPADVYGVGGKSATSPVTKDPDFFGSSSIRKREELPSSYTAFRDTLVLIWQRPTLFYVGMSQAFYEGGVFTFVFMWVPNMQNVLVQGEEGIYVGGGATLIPTGLIFSCFMLAMTLGGVLYNVLLEDWLPSSIMMLTSRRTTCLDSLVLRLPNEKQIMSIITVLVFSLAAGSMALPLYSYHFWPVFGSFLALEVSLGMYNACGAAVRAQHYPDEHQSRLINLFRIPQNLLVVVGTKLTSYAAADIEKMRYCFFAVFLMHLSALGFHFLLQRRIAGTSPVGGVCVGAVEKKTQ